MRILALLSDAYGGYGGIAQYNRDLFQSFCSSDHCEELVAVPRHIPKPIGAIPKKVTHITTGTRGKLAFILTALRTALFGKRYDLILCGHILLVPVAYLVGLLIRKPVYLFLYGIDVWDSKLSRISNLFLSRLEGFISISRFTTKRFISWSGVDREKVLEIPCAVDMDRFTPGEKDPELLKKYGIIDRQVMIIVARLNSQESKGHEETLEALAELVSQYPKLTYLIVGEGDKQEFLEQKIGNLGLQKHVVFTGLIPEEEKVALYRSSDLYVMPSRGEGFGIVLIEAAACGIPVVGSRVDAAAETLLNGELGSIVDPDNKDELKSAIVKALDPSARRRPDKVDHYSYDQLRERAHQFLQRSLDKKCAA